VTIATSSAKATPGRASSTNSSARRGRITTGTWPDASATPDASGDADAPPEASATPDASGDADAPPDADATPDASGDDDAPPAGGGRDSPPTAVTRTSIQRLPLGDIE